MLRTYQSQRSVTGWQTSQLRTLYLASNNTTTDIFPMLKMFGSTPVGKELNRPLTIMSDCTALVNGNGPLWTMTKGPTTMKFGRDVETYSLTYEPSNTSSPSSPKQVITLELFPKLGCLVGDRVTENYTKTDGSLRSRKIEKVVSLDVVPDDPAAFVGPPQEYTSGKPSDIIKADAAIKGINCPECATRAGKVLDTKHDKLWDERAAGKR